MTFVWRPPALLGLVLSLVACGPGGEVRTEGEQNAAPAMDTDGLTYLALGDSYTIGESVDSALRWPVQLAVRLREEGLPVADPTIVARTGWTTDELAAGMTVAELAPSYDLVSLLIGVNNQYRGRDLEEYRLQLREILGQALYLAGDRRDRVVVLSIPDWGVMPFAAGRDRESIAWEIDAFNRVKREEIQAMGLAYVDVTHISRGAGGDPSLVAGDGLHPSGAQYTLWVEAALPTVRALFR